MKKKPNNKYSVDHFKCSFLERMTTGSNTNNKFDRHQGDFTLKTNRSYSNQNLYYQSLANSQKEVPELNFKEVLGLKK